MLQLPPDPSFRGTRHFFTHCWEKRPQYFPAALSDHAEILGWDP